MTGTALIVEGASLSLGAFRLRNLDLALDRAEILVLLGPNGAGKSVSLEVIAGFHRLQSGRIAIGGRDVTRLPPERRAVGLVVQDFGLFPHLSVAANVAFGPNHTGVADLLRQFGIAHLAGRMPRELSAGEKQRTALARALASRPDLFLFDEPFAAIDSESRHTLRDELYAFLRKTGIAAIFVTHDPEDAWVLADRVAVMRDGAIVQTGSAEAVLCRPADRWIAAFVRVDNIVPGRIVERFEGGCRVVIGAATLRAATPIDENEVVVCIRAEEVELRTTAHPLPDQLPGRVTAVANFGAVQRIRVDCGFPLTALTTSRRARELGLAPGTQVAAEIDPHAVHLLSPQVPDPTSAEGASRE